MFENSFDGDNIVPTLGDKVKELINKYKSVVSENESLRNELTATKAQNEALNLQLDKLEEDMTVKNLSDDELFKEIEDVLNSERA
ncbi:hypothetical protein [Campylobacter corcagiensis]|uniref:DUF904 domain-containing protein n=1 Tax=Campylobacter corcagiensis TaxID=1448857 RepID=A0A7M1LED2_9BACT|nr:hypothetical protein [Campylobacter corcagiensis]QKF65166.1 hypothetical protein CCORG_1323 [Campylobacter corcagiensis]QOQ86691.1 hypothetical protein IMC76_05540 [Campylobacter corcagiensis]